MEFALRYGRSILVIGAGAGGLSAAIALALRGFAVTIVERATAPGGKMRQVEAGGMAIDAGPTVLTMKWAFDGLLAPTGKELGDLVGLKPAGVLARHFWDDGSRLDLHSDIDRSAETIGEFAGPAEAEGYRRFCADSRAVFLDLRDSYIAAQRPGPVTLARRIGLSRPDRLLRLQPFTTLWRRLGGYFHDERLRQLFARYATYCGSSPFLSPATLMLVAHVEQDGVWIADGGMHGVAQALARFAQSLGVTIRYDAEAVQISKEAGKGAGKGAGPGQGWSIRLADGETLSGDAVVFNGDISALSGLVEDRGAAWREEVPAGARSLSAMTWCVAAHASEAPLVHHNVWFANDYRAEFAELAAGRVPAGDPTVYVCAQDRGGDGAGRALPSGARERLLCLVNAPADGDRNSHPAGEVERCLSSVNRRLGRWGLTLDPARDPMVVTTPANFHSLFPGTGGAIYGRAQHGWMASFRRPGARLATEGLYLAGGSVHPGPGVPMAVISGRLAAERLMADFASTRRYSPGATIGGMSMA